jgi:hypothetical protein
MTLSDRFGIMGNPSSERDLRSSLASPKPQIHLLSVAFDPLLQAVLENHVAKWVLANDVDLVFVLIYNRVVFPNITYTDELLSRLRKVSGP